MPSSTTFLARQEMLNRYSAVPALNKIKNQNKTSTQHKHIKANKFKKEEGQKRDTGKEKNEFFPLLDILLNDLKGAMSVLGRWDRFVSEHAVY
jgi:hypothetical protein